jgi:hypothetical protein
MKKENFETAQKRVRQNNTVIQRKEFRAVLKMSNISIRPVWFEVLNTKPKYFQTVQKGAKKYTEL